MGKIKILLLAAFASVAIATASFAAQMTNADVIKMVGAKLDESIILVAIEKAEAKFDTSSQGLIDMSAAKVPPAIIAAIIKRTAGGNEKQEPAANTAPGVNEANADLMIPSEVILIDGAEKKNLRYINPQVRTAARALGMGGVSSYAVLAGSSAATRISNTQPGFIVSVPNHVQPNSYLTLASFAVRKNNSREVMIGGGWISYSSGIHPNRVIAVSFEKLADQSRAQKNFTIYKVTPQKPLVAGEYALILYTGEVQVGANWFSGSGNSYFDFGVNL